MKLLIPVDGSQACNAALDFVVSRSGHLAAPSELALLHVQPPIPPRAARAAGRELVRSYYKSESERVLLPAKEKLAAAGLKAKAKSLIGSPAEVVSQTSMQGDCDLIVMGSRGHTALKGILFGSVTQAVLAASTTPLLVVRDARPPRKESLRVVIAVDGSRYGLAAVQSALALRELFGPSPQFRLLHVAEGGTDAAGSDAATGPALALFAKADLEADVVRLEGQQVGDVIADYLDAKTADLIVMGSHGRGAFKAVFMGSVAMRVAARCKQPLLIARPQGR